MIYLKSIGENGVLTPRITFLVLDLALNTVELMPKPQTQTLGER
jgi:hypothetical protein